MAKISSFSPADARNASLTPVDRMEKGAYCHDGGGNGMDCNSRFTGIEKRLYGVEKRLDKVEISIDDLRKSVEGLRWWIVGSLLAGIAIVTAFAAYQVTWTQKYVDKSEASSRAFLEEMDRRWQAINAEQQKRYEDQQKHNDEMIKIISGRVDRLEKN